MHVDYEQTPVFQGNVSHGETHFQPIKIGRFHDLWNVETAFSVGESLNGGGSSQHHPDIYCGGVCCASTKL